MATVFPEGMVSITWIFGLSDGTTDVEIAEFTIWGQPAGGDFPSDWNAALLAWATAAYESWATNAVSTMWGGFTTLQSVKAATYSTAGKTTFEQVYVADTLWVGTGGGTVMPWQISCCVGIYSYTPGTFIADARSRRGRVFLPPMEASLISASATGEMSAGTCIAALDLVNHLVASVSTTEVPVTSGPDVGIPMGVFSRLHQHLYPVTDFRSDLKWDTQRRRTKSLSAPVHTREYDSTP